MFQKDLPVIKLGDSSSVRVGQWVIAIGCPLNYNFTVSTGIVCSNNRTGKELRKDNDVVYIQTDAATTVSHVCQYNLKSKKYDKAVNESIGG